ncbi:ATP-binding protein [Iningainema tapete]|uniref:ATP-binding protein n=1 Tax=Iningainema tapete BLCC-T55 TaxID=2748662 RepID=A0A8J7C976_9CYAN|nr:ATP-binding protein [Iningainema tapete]MBD2770715.1 ATP-binding protein [Iningainema tapete BLCC-T55]
MEDATSVERTRTTSNKRVRAHHNRQDYRASLTKRVVSNLGEGNSLMLIGEPGMGKTHLAKLVQTELDAVYAIYTGSVKACLVAIAQQIDCPIVNEDGKPLTIDRLKEEIAQNINGIILIADNVHRFPASLKYWLEGLQEAGIIMLLLGTKRDLEGVSFKMPRLKLEPLTEADTRSLIWKEVSVRNLSLPSHRVAELASRAGGNPMLAKRMIDELESGVDDPNLNDGDTYIDISPVLMAAVGILAAVRFIGLALHDRSHLTK